MTTTTLDLDRITLGAGAHREGSTEPCLLELSALLAGKPWTDHPPCVSPVLGEFGRAFNDALAPDRRQWLKPYAARLLDTAEDTAADERRSYLALDWLVRTYLPAWLRLVPALTAQADLLAAAHEVRDLDSAAAIGDLVREAASQSSAAGDAAGAAAGDAARSAARSAAGAAAWSAARSAAGDAAWSAAESAAGDAAAPTVDALQDSAFDLLDRMVAA